MSFQSNNSVNRSTILPYFSLYFFFIILSQKHLSLFYSILFRFFFSFFCYSQDFYRIRFLFYQNFHLYLKATHLLLITLCKESTKVCDFLWIFVYFRVFLMIFWGNLCERPHHDTTIHFFFDLLTFPDRQQNSHYGSDRGENGQKL